MSLQRLNSLHYAKGRTRLTLTRPGRKPGSTEKIMPNAGYRKPVSDLSAATRNMHRARVNNARCDN